MKPLEPKQKDALIEICNVGMGTAAKQLSILLDSPIDITIPNIALSSVDELESSFNAKKGQVFVFVYQTLSTNVEGRATLIFNRSNTKILTQSVIGQAPKMTEEDIRACEQEAMLEIGNIIIASSISSISNMLSRQIGITTPTYGENLLPNLLEEQVKEVGSDANNVIIVSTKLETKGEDISGSLVLILTKESIHRLLDSLDRLLGD